MPDIGSIEPPLPMYVEYGPSHPYAGIRSSTMEGFTSRRAGYSRPRFGRTLAEKFSAKTSEMLTSSRSASLASG